MSKVQVDTIDTRSGTSTMQIGSTNTSTINIGVSGDTVNIPSGVTIANAGTATGFGESNTPYFRAVRSANQTISNLTDTKVQYDTEDFDSDNAYDNSSNYRFTPQTAGKYYFKHNVLVNSFSGSTGAGYYIQPKIKKNGAVIQQFQAYDFRSGGKDMYAQCSIIVNMNGSSDYVEAWIVNSSADSNSKDVDEYLGWSSFEGFRIAT